MTILNKYRWLTCFLVIYCCLITHAQENAPHKPKLKFELSKELPNSIPWLSKIAWHEVTYFASIKLRSDRTFDPGPDGWPSALLSTEAGKSMSEKQRHFLADIPKNYYSQFGPSLGIDAIAHFYIVALSENDARKMVEALLEYLNKKAQSDMENAKKQLEEKQKNIIELEGKLKKLLESEDYQQSKEQLEKVVINSWQSKFIAVDCGSIWPESWEKMKVLNQKLTFLNFDILAIQSKIDTINKFKNDHESPRSAETEYKLDQMLVITEIELAALLAKQKAMQKSFDDAARLIEACNEIRERDLLEDNITNVRQEISKLQKKFANPPAAWKPVTVIDNKVVIYQLRQDNLN